MAGLGELFIELGVFADTKELEQAEKRLTEFVKTGQKAVNKVNDNIKANDNFQNKLKGVGTALTAVIGALTAAGYALNRLTNDLVRSNQAMLNLTRTSDISLSTFQKWGSIGKMLGVNNAAQQIEGLNQRLFELRLTGQGARGFQLAGINPTGDADAVMEQLRARVSGMSDTSASYLLREMGLDPQMLHLLRMGREEFEALGKTIKKYQLTEEQRADIQKMNIQLEIARQQLQYLKDRAILAIMPYWVRFVESFANITEFLIKASKWFGNIIDKIRMLIPVLGMIEVKNVKILAGFKKFSAPFRNLNASILKILRMIPKIGRAVAKTVAKINAAFLPVMATISALYLILDDIAGYENGKDSVIGTLINAAKGFGDEFKNAFNLFGQGEFGEGSYALLEAIVDTLNGILDLVKNILDAIVNVLTLGGWDKLKNSKFGKWLLASPQEMINETTGGAAGISSNGYEGMLPALEHKNAVSPITEQAINNSSVSNNSSSTTTLSMNNYFNTNQPAYDIERELRYVTAQFA